MIYPKKLEDLIESFKKLPTIGEKSAERLALATLEMSEEDIKNFSDSLIIAKNKLVKCKICGNLSDTEICSICSDSNRNQNIICVIEDPKSAFTFEKVGNFRGTYHVLGGLISPKDDIGIEDINLSTLVERVNKLENPELILALKSSMEGETTILYIKKLFDNKNVKISRLSYGIPMGAELEYLDVITLDKALEDRKIISE
jgi:recombination protein RecR